MTKSAGSIPPPALCTLWNERLRRELRDSISHASHSRFTSKDARPCAQSYRLPAAAVG